MKEGGREVSVETPFPRMPYLQNDRELLRWVSVLHPHSEPHLKRRQLLREKRTVLRREERKNKDTHTHTTNY